MAVSLGFNSRCQGNRSREVGSCPKMATKDLFDSVEPEAKEVMKRGGNLESKVGSVHIRRKRIWYEGQSTIACLDSSYYTPIIRAAVQVENQLESSFWRLRRKSILQREA